MRAQEEEKRASYSLISNLDVVGSPQVVFDISRTKYRVREGLSLWCINLELAEELLEGLAHDVRHQIEATTMGHANHNVLDAVLARALH